MATLRFHIAPNAKIDKVIGEYGDAIKIKVRGPAAEGKANAALRCFLAEELKIPKKRDRGEPWPQIARQSDSHRRPERSRRAPAFARHNLKGIGRLLGDYFIRPLDQ